MTRQNAIAIVSRCRKATLHSIGREQDMQLDRHAPGAVSLSRSSTLCDKPRNAGFHHWVEPLSGLNSIDFFKRVFRKCGDVEILLRAGRTSGRGKQSRAALYCPSQEHLCRRLSYSCRDRRNDWIFDRTRPASVAQWCKCQEHNALLLAKLQKLRFRPIRVRFDLDYRWLDSPRFVDRQQLFQGNVRQSDGPAFAMVHKTLHRPPGVEQSHALVIKDLAVLIPWILLFSRLKCKWSVDEVEIQIVEPESVQARLECRFDTLGPMIRVPQLRGDKDFLACDSPSGKTFLQRLAYLALVPVAFRAIEVSKPGGQRVSGRSSRHCRVRNQGAKSEGGHKAGPVA